MTDTTPIRIFLDHGEAYGNLGDEAMLANAVRRLRHALGDSVTFVLPQEEGAPLPPEVDGAIRTPSPRVAVAAAHALATRLLPRGYRFRLPLTRFLLLHTRLVAPWNVLKRQLKTCNALYCVGAANLNDLAPFATLLPKSLLIEQAKRLDLPVVLSSQTLGPMTQKWTRPFLERALKAADFVSFRDREASRLVLADLGLAQLPAQFVGDEAFSLPPASEAELETYLAPARLERNKPLALVHYRATDYIGSTEKYYPKLAEGLRALGDQYQVLFVPMSYWSHSGDDRLCGQAISEALGTPEWFTVLPECRSPRLIRALVERSDWVLALSYHLHVFCMAAKRPMGLLTSGAYYGTKTAGTQALIGDSFPVIDLETATPHDICAAIEMLTTKRDQMVSRLEEVAAEIEQTNCAPVEFLAKAVG